MVHRAIFGSFERFIGIITEHFAGAFPTWLAPVQVKVMTISEKNADYANEIVTRLDLAGVRVEKDFRNETISKKIREAQLEKIPYMLVVGDNEMANACVSIRKRSKGDIGSKPVSDAINDICKVIADKELD